MPHDAYLEISAPTHAAFGEQLGRVLAEETIRDVALLCADPLYERLKARGEPYLALARNTYPHLLEQVEGYARGAGISFEDAWLLSLEDELVPNEHCATVLTNDGRLLGHNEDWDAPNAIGRLFVLKRKIRGEETLELYYRGTLGGNACGVNGHGLVFAVNSPPKGHVRPGLPRNFVARDAAEAATAAEAARRATRDQRGSGFGSLFVDAAGQTVAIEATPTDAAMATPVLPYCHTNHYFLTPHIARRGSEESRARLHAAQTLVKPRMTEAALETAMADTTGWPERSLFNNDTIGRVIADLDKRVFRVWLKREADKGWIEYPFPRR